MKNIIGFLFLLLAYASFGQDFKKGRVSIEEVSQTSYPQDASAPAAVLYKTGTTSYDFDDKGNWILVTDVSTRIKIYNTDGLQYATVQIPVKQGSQGKEEVVFTDAATYNLEGGKVVASKLPEGSASLVQNTGGKAYQIVLPQAKAGSVIEFRYIIKSPFYTNIPDWYFQEALPVNFVQYAVSIPQYFVFNRILSPYVTVEEKQDSRKQTKRYSNPTFRTDANRGNANLQGENGMIDFYEVVKTYTAHNIPALQNDEFTDNVNNYRAFVKHELASMQYPNQPKKEYTGSWDVVAKTIYNEPGFGEELQRKQYFEKMVDGIIAKTSNGAEVISLIFDLVKNRMTWNGEYGYNARKSVATAFDEGTGNVAEINLMLVAMLRYAGYNANPVLLSTRDNGHVMFVNRDEFNYVIAAVELQDQTVLLDATSKNAVPGILPVRALNDTGRMIKNNLTSVEVSLLPTVTSKTNTAVTAKISPDGEVTGHVKRYLSNYDALVFREAYASAKDKPKEELQKAGIQVNHYAVSDNDFTKPVIEDFDFNGAKLAETSGGKIYLSPMLLFASAKNPFMQAKRAYPVDFRFPHQEKYTFSIALPEGYVVESLPESAFYQVKDNVSGYRFNITSTNKNSIQVVVESAINFPKVGAEYYPELKEFYTTMLKKQEEKIILKKAL